MSFEEQGSELKDLFFESAGELLQTLNEQGLLLESNPRDGETVRTIRRAVHTLKGDSAVCGYKEISELAHQLEDALTPEQAKNGNPFVAEVVLHAADVFGAMLAAYRNNAALPDGSDLHASIRRITDRSEGTGKKHAVSGKSKSKAKAEDAVGSSWTEYQRLVITNAASEGNRILLVLLKIDDLCPMRAAALQLVHNVLSEAGTLLAIQPEDTSAKNIGVIEAAVATDAEIDWLVRKCQIPAVVSDISIRPYDAPEVRPAGRAKAEATSKTKKAAPSSLKVEKVPEQHGTNDALPPQESGTHTAAPTSSAAPAAADSIIRVDAERIDTVMNLVGELIMGKSMLQQAVSELDRRLEKDPLHIRFNDALAFQSRVLGELQKAVMKIRMIPVEQLFRRFPRLVRDVSKACGKEVRLEIRGEDTGLDKSILDVLGEPLAHILRNAVDHGIESPAQRIAAGKPESGTLVLNAYHQGNQIVIEVSDDGRGIDQEKVIARAIEACVMTREEAAQLSTNEVLNLIFHPGLSTAEELTTISGRGVGMDVVKSVLQQLKGAVHVETAPGIGSTFYLKVPLTLAIMKALLFRVGDRVYALPLTSVVEIARVHEQDFHRVDRREVMQLRDRVITVIRLSKLAPQDKNGSSSRKFVIIVNFNGNRFGFVVDKLIGEQELVIKGLDDEWIATEFVSGASVLGDGTVVLVLNMAALIAKLGRDRATELHAARKGAIA